MNENFNTLRQQVLTMDIDLKLQLEQDILEIVSKFDQHTKFNLSYAKLGYIVELMGIELAQITLVEMYRRSKSLERIVNTFDGDNNDRDYRSDYIYFIDRSITWSETKYPHGYDKSSNFWNDLHHLFREKTDGFDFEKFEEVDSCKGMSIREVLMHNIEVKIERKPKYLKAWN